MGKPAAGAGEERGVEPCSSTAYFHFLVMTLPSSS